MSVTPQYIQKDMAAGNWKPSHYLTNVSIAHLQQPENYAKGLKLFPMVPVQFADGRYYKFDKASIARDDVRRKPQFGKVSPAILASDTQQYHCDVDQIIIGIDQIGALEYQRNGAPGMNDPRKAKVIAATEKMNIHIDVLFAKSFFQPGVWGRELTGTTSAPTATTFYQFDNPNSDPIMLLDDLIDDIAREGRRRPNKLALGVETFKRLKQNPLILERIKYGGSTANPATVNTQVLAQLFGLEEVIVLDSSYNTADVGQPAKMEYVCDPKGALLLYASKSAAIDEPSAGYTFSWDPTGNGQPMVFSQWDGEPGTHSEFIEGLCAYDMKKTADDMAVYLKDCVSE